MFTLGDITTITSTITGQPLPQIFLEATGHTGAAFGLFFMSEHFLGSRSKADGQSSSLVFLAVLLALKQHLDVFGRRSQMCRSIFILMTSASLEMVVFRDTPSGAKYPSVSKCH